MLSQKDPGKIGPSVRQECTEHRKEDQVAAMLHPLQHHQSGQGHGDHQPAEEAEQHVLHPDGLLLIVQPDGDVKQCDHQEHSGDPCHQGPPPQPLPQGDGCRGRGREAIQPVVRGHAGGPQQLIGGQGTDGGHQHRQIHRRQEKQDHKKERGQHH